MIIGIITVLVLLFGFVVFFGAPYVPTLKTDKRLIFTQVRPLTKNDVVVDLGSGDGRILREASEQGAHAVGVELNPILVLISRILSASDSKVRVFHGPIQAFTLPDDTTVVYVFTTSRDASSTAKRIQRQANRLGKTLDVISYGVELPLLDLVKQQGAYRLYKTTLQP